VKDNNTEILIENGILYEMIVAGVNAEQGLGICAKGGGDWGSS